MLALVLRVRPDVADHNVRLDCCGPYGPVTTPLTPQRWSGALAASDARRSN
jgi:hypothetical protein